jgi:hypothetical protein
MASKNSDNYKNKLMIFRIITLLAIAFLLVQFNIVSDTNRAHNISLYLFALILALPITMLLDKYIVNFAKTGSLK